VDLTPDFLIAVAGAVVSLFFAYFPWVKDKFDALDSRWKPLINAGILLVVVFGLFGLSCAGRFDYFVCDQSGVMKAVELWIAALIGNRLGYSYGVRQFKQASQ